MTLSVRCFHLLSSMCRNSEIDRRCVHLRGPDRCEISYAATLTRSTFEDPISVNFIIMLLYSCTRITPRVCTLVLFTILIGVQYITSARVGSRACCCCRILNIIYFYTCTYERVSFCPLHGLRSAVVDNIRRRIVGVMFPPSIFEDRCVDFRRSMCQLSNIDVSPFEDRCVALRRSMSRCVDLRRWMC